MRVSTVVHTHNGFCVIFAYVLNFKKRLFCNKRKEVTTNNGTNKGASETKHCSHVAETSFFIPILFL